MTAGCHGRCDRALAAVPIWLHATTAMLVLTVACGLAWAAVAQVDEVTRGEGRVIPASRIQLVQNLEGGILRRIATHEGAQVRQGDVLVQIDPTGFGSSLDERREKLNGLRAVLARLEAQAELRSLAMPEDILRERPALAREQAELHSHRSREVEAALAALDLQIEQRGQEIEEARSKAAHLARGLDIAREEWALTKPLVDRGAAARVELIRLEARLNELRGGLDGATLASARLEKALAEARSRRAEREMATLGETRAQLSETRVQVAALEQSIRADLDRVDRTDVRAPADGVVKALHVSTPGQIVKPGMDIIEIVPSGDTLLVEARVRPQDIAHLRPGLNAIVRLTAYDYTAYGVLHGRLEHIGADTVQAQHGDTFYPVRVRTHRASLAAGGREHPILPGMVANIDILTGRKTVLGYLLGPMTRLRSEALRER